MLSDERLYLIDTYGLSEDYLDLLIELTKQRLGIMTDAKRYSIEARVYSSILKLLAERGIVFEQNNAIHTMFIVDAAAWEYRNLEKGESMPLDLRYRLNNIFVKSAAIGDETESAP
jgi:hypothetical protein